MEEKNIEIKILDNNEVDIIKSDENYLISYSDGSFSVVDREGNTLLDGDEPGIDILIYSEEYNKILESEENIKIEFIDNDEQLVNFIDAQLDNIVIEVEEVLKIDFETLIGEEINIEIVTETTDKVYTLRKKIAQYKKLLERFKNRDNDKYLQVLRIIEKLDARLLQTQVSISGLLEEENLVQIEVDDGVEVGIEKITERASFELLAKSENQYWKHDKAKDIIDRVKSRDNEEVIQYSNEVLKKQEYALVMHSQAMRKMIDFGKERGSIDENGGVMLGYTDEDKMENVICDFIGNKKYGDLLSASFVFTPDMWSHFFLELDKLNEELAELGFDKELKILGWFHTHPALSTFLSGQDLFIQNGYFNQKNQLAIVYDPRNEQFSSWDNSYVTEKNLNELKKKYNVVTKLNNAMTVSPVRKIVVKHSKDKDPEELRRVLLKGALRK